MADCVTIQHCIQQGGTEGGESRTNLGAQPIIYPVWKDEAILPGNWLSAIDQIVAITFLV